MGLACWAGSLPAWAVSTSQVTISALEVRLIDLAPGDGAAPGIEFLGRTDLSGLPLPVLEVSVQGLLAAGPSLSQQAQSATPQPLLASVGQAGLSVEAGFQVGASWASLASSVAGATGSPAGPFGSANSYFGNAHASQGGAGAGFRLSPMTLVEFTLVVDARASTSGRCHQLRFFVCDYATASFSLSAEGSGSQGQGGSQYSGNWRDLVATAESGRVWDPIAGRWTDDYLPVETAVQGLRLSASFVNLSAGALSGSVAIGSNISGAAYVGQVPEAASWWLLVAGLAALGGGRRLAKGRA